MCMKEIAIFDQYLAFLKMIQYRAIVAIGNRMRSITHNFIHQYGSTKQWCHFQSFRMTHYPNFKFFIRHYLTLNISETAENTAIVPPECQQETIRCFRVVLFLMTLSEL